MELASAEVVSRKSSQRLVWILLVAIGMPVLLLTGCVSAVSTLVAHALLPTQRDGFLVGQGTCTIDGETGHALVELPIQSAAAHDRGFHLEALHSDQIQLVGIASLPDGQTVKSLHSSARQVARAQVDDGDDRPDWGYSANKPTNLVFEFKRDLPVTMTKLPRLTLWWADGEPAYVQDVELNLDWSPVNCTVHAE
jgi:hypothetical protein